MDAIISILFLIILIFVVYMFAQILFPLILVFFIGYFIYTYLLKPILKPKTNPSTRRPDFGNYQSPPRSSSNPRPTSSEDVFDAEFETRDIHDES